MLDACIDAPADFEVWRRLARAALWAELPPERVAWRDPGSAPDLQVSGVLRGENLATIRVPPRFVDLARQGDLPPVERTIVSALPAPLERITHGERALLEICVDPDVRHAVQMAKAVRRDVHKMKAFVRFRQVAGVEPEQFVAWFEPQHHVVSAVAPFFRARFASMRWSIDAGELGALGRRGAELCPGARRQSAPADDALDDLWRTYYAHIFNPARLKVQAMRAEMPVRYWRNLPEARVIKPLVRQARQRTGQMIDADLPPHPPGLESGHPRRARRPRRPTSTRQIC